MKTTFIKKKDISRKWFLVDAAGQPMGRLASKVATILQGKHKPDFSTNLDTGDCVICINAKDIALSGKKSEELSYFRHSTRPGSDKVTSFEDMMEKDPAYPLYHSIKGMLPKNTRGRQLVKKLFVYADAEHPHAAQKPESITL